MRPPLLKTISAAALTLLPLLAPALGGLALAPALTAPALAFQGGGDCAAMPSPGVRRMCREAGFGGDGGGRGSGRPMPQPVDGGPPKGTDRCHTTLMIGCGNPVALRSNGHDAGFDRPPSTER